MVEAQTNADRIAGCAQHDERGRCGSASPFVLTSVSLMRAAQFLQYKRDAASGDSIKLPGRPGSLNES